jgi:hypothetical protein
MILAIAGLLAGVVAVVCYQSGRSVEGAVWFVTCAILLSTAALIRELKERLPLTPEEQMASEYLRKGSPGED